MGKEIYYSKQSRALQTWARRLGFGRLTRIDTGSESDGVVPSRKWRDDLNRREADCRAGRAPFGDPKPQGCGIADGNDRPYSAGDNVNLAIGQGDLQATPLQVALSYSAIATGGTIPTPHLGVRIEDGNGTLVQKLKPKGPRRVPLPADRLAAIRDGLHAAASKPGGTSADVFAGWDQNRFPVFGKTGTAQVAGKGDQSWYAAYVPSSPTNRRPLLVVATVEGGGFGAEAAAPMVRQILSQWYLKKPGPFKVGASSTR
jgi:penicillin-binding protein 2